MVTKLCLHNKYILTLSNYNFLSKVDLPNKVYTITDKRQITISGVSRGIYLDDRH